MSIKTNMKQHFFIYLLFMLSSVECTLYGQINFKKGWIVSLNNDTLNGFVNDGGTISNTKYCYFKPQKGIKAFKYTPKEIKAYGFIDGKRYASHKLHNKNEDELVFLELLVQGKLTLFYYYKNNKMLYYIQKPNGTLVGLSNEHINIGRPESIGTPIYYQHYTYETNLYKDSLYRIFKDNPSITKHLSTLKYTDKALINISKAYLQSQCQTTPCIRYEKDLTMNRIRVGIFTGIQTQKLFYSGSNVESNILVSMPVGIFFNIPLNYYCDRLSFQIEIAYRQLQSEQQLRNLSSDVVDDQIIAHALGIPLLFNYKIPIKNVTYVLGLGKELGFILDSDVLFQEWTETSTGRELIRSNDIIHYIQKGGWFFDLGLEYKFSPKLSFFSNLRFQKHQNLSGPKIINNFAFANADHRNDSKKIFSELAFLRIGLSF